VKLLLDEMISPEVAERLRAQDHDVEAVAGSSLGGLGDAEVFAAAQDQGRALVTYNRDDYLELIRRYAERDLDHNGLIIVHPTRYPNDQFARLVEALAGFITSYRAQPSFVAWLKD
jgi:Domain of unknown function (DUF5615)